jgi:hypothetical protein
MLQLPKTGVIQSLAACIALNVLEEAADEAKGELAIGTLVPVVLVPAVGVVSGLITSVGQAIKFITVGAVVAST